MDKEEVDEQFVACEGWRWVEGMLRLPNPHREFDGSSDGRRFLGYDGATLLFSGVINGEHEYYDAHHWGPALPDLNDPATLGCILALARELNDDPVLCISFTSDGQWYIDDVAAIHHGLFDTEAEALLDALQGAPKR